MNGRIDLNDLLQHAMHSTRQRTCKDVTREVEVGPPPYAIENTTTPTDESDSEGRDQGRCDHNGE